MRRLSPLQPRPSSLQAGRRRVLSPSPESLEGRLVLSTISMGPFSALADTRVPSDHVGDGAHDLVDAYSRTQYINGVANIATWEPAPANAPASAQGLTPLTSAHPLSSLPFLHSNPGAKATLFLDFNGHYEAVWGAWSNITTPVYDIDGDAARRSATVSCRTSSDVGSGAPRITPRSTSTSPRSSRPCSPGCAANPADKVAQGRHRRDVGLDGSSWGGYSLHQFVHQLHSQRLVRLRRGCTTHPYWIGDTISHEAGPRLRPGAPKHL